MSVPGPREPKDQPGWLRRPYLGEAARERNLHERRRARGAATIVLAAYGAGMGAVMMALALLAGGARDWVVKTVRRALPRMERISGALLVVAGVYLSYYWLRILFGPVATLADDPVVGTVQRFTTRIERIATANSAAILAVSVIVVVGVGGYLAWRMWQRDHGPQAGTGTDLPEEVSKHARESVDAGRP